MELIFNLVIIVICKKVIGYLLLRSHDTLLPEAHAWRARVDQFGVLLQEVLTETLLSSVLSGLVVKFELLHNDR